MVAELRTAGVEQESPQSPPKKEKLLFFKRNLRTAVQKDSDVNCSLFFFFWSTSGELGRFCDVAAVRGHEGRVGETWEGVR